MAIQVFMPKMSDNMEAGEVIEWLVQAGSAVEKGQPILSVMTDKATVDLEAPTSGILKGLREGVAPGANVPVGETIAFIASADEDVPSLPPLQITLTGAAKGQPAAAAEPGPTEIERCAVRASPAVRHLAKQLGIDLTLVRGTGPEGRVTEGDVKGYASGKDGDWLDLNPVQRVTGQRMLESTRSAPHFALAVDLDMTNLLNYREAWMESVVKATGQRLSVTGILIKAVACALKKFPRANASFDGGRIKLHKQVNIGVAIGTEQGLVVPVIQNADRKSLVQISQELAVFQEKAAAMRFSADDLAGGTFTISNLGMHGVDRFQAIINPPESAILAVGRIIKAPVGMPDGTIALRPMMSCTLSIDHRSLDGMQGAKFLAQVKALVENPESLAE